MKFTEFLKQAKKKSFWDSNNVICFRSETYPLLFCRTLFDHLNQKEIASITTLHVDNRLQLWKTLQQSFLGGTSFYWLGNVVEKLKKQKQKKNEPAMVELLSLYKGPHRVAFFVPEEHKPSASALKRMLLIDLPDVLSLREINELFLFFGIKRKIPPNIVKIDIDTSCMLANYLAVTSARLMGSLNKSLASIISVDLSLYDLSRAFFVKDKTKFFSLWANCNNDYSVPFWVVYWGEQIWRAYNVVRFMRKGNFPAARRFSFGLPASFVKGDWRRCSLKELEKAYLMVYDIDFAFKKGSTFCSFDLFYSNYFLGKFDASITV